MNSSLKLLMGLGAVSIFIGGCAVDQKREVAHYRKTLDAQVPPTIAPADNEPLNVQQAMMLANQNNEQLGLSGEDYVQALIDKNRAVSAFLPTVSFQPNYTIAQKPGRSGNAGTTGTASPGGVVSGTSTAFRVHGDTIQKFDAPVVGNIELFNGFSDLASLRAADAIIAQRRDLLLNLQATVLLNVAQMYYQVLRSERAVVVLTHSVELQEARLNDVDQQFHNGLATRLAVAQTRADMDATRVSLVQAQSDVHNARSMLGQLIGQPFVFNPLNDSYAVPDQLSPVGDYLDQAANGRQDLQAALHQVQAAREGITAAIGEYYPSVSLNVNAFLYREFYADSSKWNAILSANLPIFSAGQIEADVRTAWSRLRQAALNESAVRRQAINDVQVSYENLQSAIRRTAELRDEVAAAQESFDQSVGAFHNGLGTNLDVITSQDQLLNSQLQLDGAVFDRTVFYLNLIRSTGQLATSVNAPPATQPTTNP